ncbi:lyase family protein [Thermoproteota archaeon]
MTMSHLNDLATDLHIWSTHEFRLVETADEYCGSSSIMPQKKNPQALEMIKRAGGASITWLSTALSSIRGPGTGDTATREVPVTDEALKLTRDMLDLMNGVLDILTVHEDRMRELVGKNWSTANNLADFFVKEKGISYRTAHHVVGRLVRIALDEGKTPMEINGDMVDRAANETIGRTLGITVKDIKKALDPDIFVKTRVTKGSINPNEIKRMLKESNKELKKEIEWVSSQKDNIIKASEKLEKSINKIISA